MNTTLQEQLTQVRVTLFGIAKPKRTRRLHAPDLVHVAVGRNTRSNMQVNSVTVSLPVLA